MSENTSEQVSRDEQIAQAQELLGVATRNYYVKSYSDAADDFSTACSILAEVYGPSAEELGKPYLMYAKCLIALGQDENKLMEIPEEQPEDDDEDDDEDGDEDEDDEDGDEDDAKEAVNGEAKKTDAESGATSSSAAPAAVVDPAQPGTSTGITESAMDNKEDLETDDVGNLQVAWEVLELATGIFSGLPERAKELAEVYIELAGISFENENFEAAVKDFQKALNVLDGIAEKNHREFAEINYKIGLAYTMLNMFDEAASFLQKACSHIDEVIKVEEAKERLKPEELEAVVKDLKDTKAEIENKIAEVNEYKEQSIDEVKRELAKLVGNENGAEAAPAEKENRPAASTKPASDISHLIKRKRPAEDATGPADPLVKRVKE